MEPTQSQASLGLEYARKVVRRRGWVIVLCVVLTTGVAFGFSKTQTTEYTATASLLFNNASVAQQASGVQVSTQFDAQGQRDTNLTLVQLANVVAQRTANALNAGITAQQVKNAVTASAQGQSDIVSISADWTNPAMAARIANTFTNEFIQQQREDDQATIQNGIALVRHQYTALTKEQKQTPQGQSLLDHLESLRILKAMQNSTQLAQAATAPTSPSSPKVLRNTIVGAILGLLLGFGIAFLMERVDRKLREPADAEKALDLPMLGLIPHRSDGTGLMAGIGLEPFRMLRAHLRYFNVDRELRTLLVTSAQPAEGKTTVAQGLAAAAASMGTKTLLIEADLRRPSLARLLRLEPHVGLGEALVGAAPREMAIQQVDVESRLNGDLSRRALDVLPAGAIPPNPTELLESHAMEDLLAWSRVHYELVLVDTAPLSVVADAIPLIKRVDGVIAVTRLGVSTRDAAERLRERFVNLGAPVLGVVVNDVRTRGASYGYGYEYGYGAELPSGRATRPGAEAVGALTAQRTDNPDPTHAR
jgi:receptor protein-tyrosine kinase